MSDQHNIDHATFWLQEDRDYLLKRAEDHSQLAEKSQKSHSRTLHLRFAQLYRERAELLPAVVPD